MNIKKVNVKKGSFVMEFDDKGNDKIVIYDKENVFDMKQKVKEFKKRGTLTFSTINGQNINNVIVEPSYLKISKLIEAYIKESLENEKSVDTKRTG